MNPSSVSKQFRALVDSINTKILSPKEKGLPQVFEEAPFRLLGDVTTIKGGIGGGAPNVALDVALFVRLEATNRAI